MRQEERMSWHTYILSHQRIWCKRFPMQIVSVGHFRNVQRDVLRGKHYFMRNSFREVAVHIPPTILLSRREPQNLPRLRPLYANTYSSDCVEVLRHAASASQYSTVGAYVNYIITHRQSGTESSWQWERHTAWLVFRSMYKVGCILCSNSSTRLIFDLRQSDDITNALSSLSSLLSGVRANPVKNCITDVSGCARWGASIPLYSSLRDWFVMLIFYSHLADQINSLDLVLWAAVHFRWPDQLYGISYRPMSVLPHRFQIFTGSIYLKFHFLALFILYLHSVDLETFCDKPL